MHDYYFNEIDKEVNIHQSLHAEKERKYSVFWGYGGRYLMDIAAFAESQADVEEKDFGAIANRELAYLQS